MCTILESAVAEIEEAYDRLDTGLGWQFLYSPARSMSCPTGVMFVGINPGGDQYSTGKCSPDGNAYLIGSWPGNGKSLQCQVFGLFKVLFDVGVVSGESPKGALNATLTTNYCPFRSPKWSLLPDKKACEAYSDKLWSRLLPEIRPRLIICMGTQPYNKFSDILEQLTELTFEMPEMDTDWGSTCYRARQYEFRDSNLTLAYIPHLSNHKLLSRDCYVNRLRVFAEELRRLISDFSIQL